MSRITTKDQVTIPKLIRDELGLQPGDEVTFKETDKGIVIRKVVRENRFQKWHGVAATDRTVEDRIEELRGGWP